MTTRNKPAIFLIAATVVFVLAAGTFGTLWIIERADHDTVSSELADVQNQAGQEQAKLRTAEDRHKEISGKLQEAVTKQRSTEVLEEQYQICADGARALANAITARNEAAATDALSEVNRFC